MNREPASLLHSIVKAQLSGSESYNDIERLVESTAVTASIDADIVTEVLEMFHSEMFPDDVELPMPRLLVDWGELPRVGYQVRPEFSLLCPAYESRPEVQVKVDQDLDHNANDPLRRLQVDEPGLWTFHVPFRMTSDGMDCCPGHYMIDVEVSFRDAPAKAPRFFRCRIRLNVPDLNSEQGGELVIDGDGQSMVNLQGYNLKQFSKVVLKGGEDGVINLQNSFGESEPAESQPEPDDTQQTTFEYQLKVNSEKQSRLPSVSERFTKRSYLDACGLFFEDGRRTLVFSRPRLTLGRSRDNDVVIRFLPSGEENNANSRNVSRTHAVFELVADGIELRDESRSGIELNYSVVRDRDVLPTGHSGEVSDIRLGVTGTVPQSFDLQMTIFGPDRFSEQEELEFWHELYTETVGGRLSRLARESLAQRFDALRIDRMENLAGEESYVVLAREALIGGSPNTAAIALSELDPKILARLLHLDRTFWIEPLASDPPIEVDGERVPVKKLVPLSPGMQIKLGDEIATFDRPSQLYLD